MVTLIRALFFRVVVRAFLRIAGLEVRGGEHLATDEQVLIVSNHNSHIDTVVLMELVGVERMARVRPVAAADYFESSWLVRTLSRVFFNILPVRRRGEQGDDPLETMAAAIQAGESLIVFPEGTRGEPEKLARFRPGAGHLLARFPDLKVVPVYLAGMGRMMPKGSWIPWPARGASARIGAPTVVRGTAKEITKALEEMVIELREG